MTAALAAAAKGASVTIYERNDRPGKKILATGNGKCNLGNRNLTAEHYHDSDREKITGCLNRFGTKQTERFFAGLGLLLKEKNGYLYPACEQAAVVLDVLRSALTQAKISLKLQHEVKEIRKLKDGTFDIKAAATIEGAPSGKAVSTERFDCVILSCGSKAAPATGSDGSGYLLARQLGLSVTDVVPALVQLRCRDDFCKSIAGVRAEAGIRIMNRNGQILMEERGELQLTDYGISGIPVFQLSGRVNFLLEEQKRKNRPADILAVIDFLPEMTDAQFRKWIAERESLIKSSRTVEEFFTGILHKKLMMLLIKQAGLKANQPIASVPDKIIRGIYEACKCFPMHITGSNSYDSAQVCAGGVALTEVNADLESRKVPGLFLAGELLDVDGECGGYNLQWAWTSGTIAGEAAAKESSMVTGSTVVEKSSMATGSTAVKKGNMATGSTTAKKHKKTMAVSDKQTEGNGRRRADNGKSKRKENKR